MAAGTGTGDDLAGSTLRAVKWNFAATMASLVGRLAFTFVLARILGPGNFGVVAVATIYVAFVAVVLDQGFGVAIVQKAELEDGDVGSVAWLNVTSGAVLMALTIVLAPVVADFFDTPDVVGVLRVLSVALLMRGLTLVPLALLRRALRFRDQALAQTSAMLAGGAVGVAAALLGAGYWSLVAQILVTDVVTTTWLLLVAGPTSWRASWQNLRSMLRFSTHVMLAGLVGFFGSNADNLLVARFEGATQLAFYALAYRLLRLPIQTSASVVTGVALPVLSRLQDDDARTRSWFLQATQALGLLTFPVFTLLAVGAHDGVLAFFGREWLPAVAPVQAMALAGIPMVVRMLLAPLATSRAWTANVLTWSVVVVGLQVAGFVVGVLVAGMVGVAVALLVVQWATWLPNVARTTTPLLGLRLRSYLAVLWPAAACSVVAALVWVLAEHGQGAVYGGSLVVRVLVSAAVALGVYAALLRLAWPQVFGSATALLRQLARRQQTAAAAA